MPYESTSTASTTITDLHSDVLIRALRLLDGPSLASACSASSHLRSLSSQSDLWLHLCLSTWPSLHHPLILPFLSSSPRSFFSDAFPFPNSSPSAQPQLPDHLISAVDIHHRGIHIFSRVIETETASSWFRSSPFFIDAMDQKTEPMLPRTIISPEDLTLSWILIDPARGRAMNASSRRAVAIERNCYTGETMVRFASVAAAGDRVIRAVVTCGEVTGHVREVVLTADEIDGGCVSGEEAMKVVWEMMGAGRKGRGGGEEEEEAKQRYLEYMRRKKKRKEIRARKEGVLDMCCTAVGVVVFLAFVSMIVFR